MGRRIFQIWITRAGDQVVDTESQEIEAEQVCWMVEYCQSVPRKRLMSESMYGEAASRFYYGKFFK